MYSSRSGLILGFHGCDLSIRDKVISGEINDLENSENSYDWLGSGIYFWENNPKRALSFAKEQAKWNSKKVKKPSVLGAVIDLGYCLDLLDSSNLELLKSSYENLIQINSLSEITLPVNKNYKKSKNKNDLLIRELDCAVIQNLHSTQDLIRKFDSVRGLFTEGNPVYQGAGFRMKDHLQICIRNPNCIKGYFLPRNLNTQYSFI